MSIIDGRVDLDIKDLVKLVEELKKAKTAGEDITSGLSRLRAGLEDLAKSGKVLEESFAKASRELLSSAQVTRIDQIRNKIIELQTQVNLGAEKSVRNQLEELKLEEKKFISAENINNLLSKRLEIFKSTPKTDESLKFLESPLKGIEGKYLEQSTLELVKEVQSLTDAYDQANISASKILKTNEALTEDWYDQAKQIAETKRLLDASSRSNTTAEEMARLFPDMDKQEYFTKPLEKSLEKAKDIYTRFFQSINKIASEHYSVSAAPIQPLPGTTLYSQRASDLLDIESTAEAFKTERNYQTRIDLLKQLNEQLINYSTMFKTVSGDELKIISDINNINLDRDELQKSYGQQVLRTSQQIFEVSLQELETKERLLKIEQDLQSGIITKDQYEQAFGKEVLENTYFNIQRVEDGFNSLRKALSGHLTEGKESYAKVIAGDLGGLLSDSSVSGAQVTDSSKLALFQMAERLSGIKDESKRAIVEGLIQPLRELSDIKIPEDNYEPVTKIISTMGDPTVASTAQQYTNIMSELAKSIAYSDPKGVKKEDLESYQELTTLVSYIDDKYKDMLGDREKLSQVDGNTLSIMQSMRETLDGLRYLGSERVNSAAQTLFLTEQEIVKERQAHRLATEKAAAEAKALKMKQSLAKEYYITEEQQNERSKQADASKLRNIANLRDMMDQLYASQKLDKALYSDSVSESTLHSFRELFQTVEQFGKEITKDGGLIEVVSPEQIKYLEKIRNFLADNAGVMADSQDVSNERYRQTVNFLTKIIAQSQNYKDNIKSVGKNIENNNEDLDDTEKKVSRLSLAFDAMAGKIGHAFKMVILYRLVRDVIQKARQALQYMISTSIQYEQAMANVAAVSSATSIEIRRLEQAAIKAGQTTRYTSVEVADSLYYMAQAGYKAAEAIASLNGVLVLAQATGESVEQTSALMAATFRQFRLETIETDRIANVYAASINKSMSSLEKLSVSLKQAGPVAGALNITLEDTVGLLDLMYNNGIQGSRAGRALRNAFADMANPSSKLSKELEKIGLDFANVDLSSNTLTESLGYLQDAQLSTGQIMKMFGKVIGTQMVVILKSSREELEHYIDQVTGTNHAYEAMEVQMDTLRGDMDRLKASFSATAAVLSEVLSPVGRGFVSVLRVLSDVVGGLVGMLIKKNTKLEDLSDNMFNLTKMSNEYMAIVTKLETRTDKLSGLEKTMLENRKMMLELEYIQKAKELSKQYDDVLSQSTKLKTVSNRYQDFNDIIIRFQSIFKDMETGIRQPKMFNQLLTSLRENNSEMDALNKEVLKLVKSDPTLKKFADSFESVSEMISVATRLMTTNLEENADMFKSGEMRVGWVETFGKILESISEASYSITDFDNSLEDLIGDLALLYKQGIVNEAFMVGWNKELVKAIKAKADFVKIKTDDEGIWFDPELDTEDFDKFSKKVESFIDKIAKDLTGIDFASTIEEGFRIEAEAVAHTRKEYEKEIKERYEANLDMIKIAVDLNEEGEEGLFIASEASRLAAKEKVERQKAREEAALNYLVETKLAEIAYEKRKRNIDLTEEERKLLEKRIADIHSMNQLEPEYEKKLLDHLRTLTETDYYGTRASIMKLAQRKELHDLQKAEREKLITLAQSHKEEIDQLNINKTLAIEAENASYAARSRLREAEFNDAKDGLKNQYSEEERLSKEYLDKVKKLTNENREEKISSEKTHNKTLAYIDSDHKALVSKANLQYMDQTLYTEKYYQKETEDALRYHLLQLEQLELDMRQKQLDRSLSPKVNENTARGLVELYRFEKDMRDKRYKLEVDGAFATYNAQVELNGDLLSASRELMDELAYIEEKRRKEDYEAEKEHTKNKLSLISDYATEVANLMSNLFSAINAGRQLELQEELSRIDKQLESDLVASDERYIRALAEDNLLSKLGKQRLQQLDAEVKAAKDSGNEEALIAAETARKKFFSDEWQHYEKLQNYDDAIKKALESGSEEEISKARTDKAKYESEKAYQDEKKALEEKAAIDKAKLEYEYALKEWQLQSVQIVADAAIAIVKAWMSPFPLNLITVPAAIAGTAAAITSHSGAKPIPQFETGGIVLGSREGTLARVGEKNKTELISNPEQMANLLLAIGNKGLNSGNLQQTIIIVTEDRKELAKYVVEDNLNKGILTIDASKAIRKGRR